MKPRVLVSGTVFSVGLGCCSCMMRDGLYEQPSTAFVHSKLCHSTIWHIDFQADSFSANEVMAQNQIWASDSNMKLVKNWHSKVRIDPLFENSRINTALWVYRYFRCKVVVRAYLCQSELMMCCLCPSVNINLQNLKGLSLEVFLFSHLAVFGVRLLCWSKEWIQSRGEETSPSQVGHYQTCGYHRWIIQGVAKIRSLWFHF